MDKKSYDKSLLKEEEIQNLLKVTSEKSLNAIAKETEILNEQEGNDIKISLEEVAEFLKEISPFKAPKINRKELRAYLGAFPKTYSNKEIAFLMNGEYEMDAATLH